MQIANPILFYHGDSAWTLGEVMIAAGIGLLVLCFILMPFVFRALKVDGRRVTGLESATGAMTAGHPSDEKVGLVAHGPAVGVEWGFEFTIGGLRTAWQQRRYSYFYGIPLYWSLWPFGINLLLVGLSIRDHNLAIALVLGGFMSLMQLSAYFMMWAAVYTDLK